MSKDRKVEEGDCRKEKKYMYMQEEGVRRECEGTVGQTMKDLSGIMGTPGDGGGKGR